MKRILNHLISGSGVPSGRDGSPSRPSVGAIRDRADSRTLGAPRSPSSESGCEKLNSRAGFSLIEVMVSAVLAVIVVWAAGTQIINVLRYHNEYRIDAILLEDLTRVANGVQSRIEMCTNWVPNVSGGVTNCWEGGFPAQINGVAFETNRFTNVTNYQFYATNYVKDAAAGTYQGAFVEKLSRNPKGGPTNNIIRRFIASEPGFRSVSNSVNCTGIQGVKFSSFLQNPPGTIFNSNSVIRIEFSTVAEWRWAGRTYTNRVTVPRMIVLYNKN